jgi:hypothetical protein
MYAPEAENKRATSELPQALTNEPSHVSDQAGAAENADLHQTDETQPKRRKQREPRKTAAKKTRKTAARSDDTASNMNTANTGHTPDTASPATEPSPTAEETPAPARKAARKTASSRNRRPRKTTGGNDTE